MLAARGSVTYLALLVTCVPLFVSAALTAGGSSSKAADACKTGSVQSSSKTGQISGGGKEFDNVIYVSGNHVTVKCRPTKNGEVGEVVYCGESGECTVVSKDSQQGKNLLQIFTAARSAGIARGDSFYVDPQTLTEQILTPSQFRQVNDSIIGRPSGFGFDYNYASVIDTIGNFSSSEKDAPGSLSEAADLAITVKSQLASLAQPNESPALLPFPTVYPPSWGLSAEPKPYAIDAYPTEAELYHLQSSQSEKSGSEYLPQEDLEPQQNLAPGPGSLGGGASNETFLAASPQGESRYSWIDTVFPQYPQPSPWWQTWLNSVGDIIGKLFR